jgi:hypothetical protein
MIPVILATALLLDTRPPPPRYDSGRYTADTIYVTNPNYYCQQINGEIRSYQPTVVIACYAPSIDTVIMPYYCDPKRYKPSGFCQELYRHELGHARGGMHIKGEWVDGYWVK